MLSNRAQKPSPPPTAPGSPKKLAASLDTATSSSSKNISGLPTSYYRDVQMDTAKGLTMGLPDIQMGTAKGYTMSGDIRMETARGGGTTMKQGGFQMWERELLDSPEVKRKATVAQLCE